MGSQISAEADRVVLALAAAGWGFAVVAGQTAWVQAVVGLAVAGWGSFAADQEAADRVVAARAGSDWDFVVVHPDSVGSIAHSLPLLLLRSIEGLT